MSGGHFDYNQFRINDIVESIERLIQNNNKTDEYGLCENFTKKTIGKFKKTQKALKKAEAMATRIDWLVSGDDGENDFHERWKEEKL